MRQMFMDSGAFSSWTLGEKQSLPVYCAFLHRYGKYIDHYAVLDAIGDAKATWDNQLEMEKRGLAPVPCFHYADDFSYLVKYLDRYPYIALGGMVGKGANALTAWLDEVWDKYLTSADGMPAVKIHGFGLTSFALMERYPWFSVDSSSWLYGSKGGMVYLYINGQLLKINIADNSSKIGGARQHFLTETPATQGVVDAYIKARGFSPDDLLSNWVQRNVFNALTFHEYSLNWKLRPLKRAQFNLLSTTTLPRKMKAPAPWKHLELYCAGDLGVRQEWGLWEGKVNRMFSYHLLKKKVSSNFTAIMAARDGKPFPKAQQ